jgi:hypothetical protein
MKACEGSVVRAPLIPNLEGSAPAALYRTPVNTMVGVPVLTFWIREKAVTPAGISGRNNQLKACRTKCTCLIFPVGATCLVHHFCLCFIVLRMSGDESEFLNSSLCSFLQSYFVPSLSTSVLTFTKDLKTKINLQIISYFTEKPVVPVERKFVECNIGIYNCLYKNHTT